MIQTILVLILFLLAVGYIGRMLWQSFFAGKGGCAKACGSCPVDSLKAIEELVKK